jgi:16S rRNA (guanine966-N2)-methyltransferase
VRIISGKFRGRQIHPPSNIPVRPTTDFAKESLFNILTNLIDFSETKVLDLFSGTGNITFEFFSRDCPQVTAVELNFKCCSFIKHAAANMNAACIKVVRSDVFRYIQVPGPSYDLIFADPPYELESLPLLPDLILMSPLLAEDGLFVLEHSKRHDFSHHPMFSDHRTYGNVNFSFFRKQSTTSL